MNTHTQPNLTTRSAEIHVHPKGIVVITMKPRIIELLTDAQANVAAVKSLIGEHKAPLMIDIRGVPPVSREVRQYYTGPETRSTFNALALIIDSGVSRIMGNLMLSLQQRAVPTRLYTSSDEALAWLEPFI